MEEINSRLVELRKACNLTQAEMAPVLGLSRSGIADIETGKRKVNRKHLIMLENWKEHNVNINWLLTGEGEKFLPRENDLLESIKKEYHLSDPQFGFICKFLKLPEEQKNVVFGFLESLFSNPNATEELNLKIQQELDQYQTNSAQGDENE